MKLNLGCGFNKPGGYVNVDKFEACRPDLLMDVEVFPWKFKTGEVDEVLFNHSLGHMGRKRTRFSGSSRSSTACANPGRYLAFLNTKQISEEELNVMIRERNNVVMEYKITLEVIK